jgi:PASTA domain
VPEGEIVMTHGTRRLFVVLSAGMVALALGAGAVRPAPARAAGAITFDGSPGTGTPPSTLGPYTMQRFGDDPRPLNTVVSGVTGPTGQVGFTPALLYVGGKGSNWPAADSYYTGNLGNLNARNGIGATSMTFTLPPGTKAFYFYAQPFGNLGDVPPQTWPMSATAQDGTASGTIRVAGADLGGAQYFGFYTDGSANLTSIRVDSPLMDFLVGEFGIALAIVPNVVGLPAANAVSAIRSAGLVPIEVSSIDTTCNNIGYVIKQSPQAGARIAIGSPVSITVAVKPPNPCP